MTYRILAYSIAALVVVQASVMVWAIAGLGTWVEDGGVLDAAAFESSETLFPEEAGFMLHGMNGMMVIPSVALVLFIFSLFTKKRRAIGWAGLVLGLVAVQITLGLMGHEVAALGALHGINALALFTCAIVAARTGMRTPTEVGAAAPSAVETV